MRTERMRLGLALTLYALLAGGCYQSYAPGDGGLVPVADAPVRDASGDVPVIRPDVPPDVPRGDPCARDSDCMVGLCVLDLAARPDDGAPVELACGAAGAISPGTECDENLECENGLCALAGGCVEPCLTDSDCRPDERCTSVPVITDRRAMQIATACARWADTPEGVAITENEDVRVTPSATERFSLPPAAADRRLILHVADRYDELRTIDSLSLRSGATLHDITSFGRAPQINPAVGYFDVSAILIRIAPWRAGLNPRSALDYTITAGGESTHHRIVMEHAGAGRTLDLNVFYVGIGRTARSRGTVTDMLDAYRDILSAYGARLGRVREFEAVGSIASRFTVIEGDTEVMELFRLSAGAARPAVNLFLIASSPTFLGIAGGIPGAIAAHGTGASGIALGFEDLEMVLRAGFGIRYAAVVLAHEIGHFSGLFHTSEAEGETFEPLPDTGVCPLSRDTNGDSMLTSDECDGFGGDNIMFWAADSADATFSASQRDILSASPVLLP